MRAIFIQTTIEASLVPFVFILLRQLQVSQIDFELITQPRMTLTPDLPFSDSQVLCWHVCATVTTLCSAGDGTHHFIYVRKKLYQLSCIPSPISSSLNWNRIASKELNHELEEMTHVHLSPHQSLKSSGILKTMQAISNPLSLQGRGEAAVELKKKLLLQSWLQ